MDTQTQVIDQPTKEVAPAPEPEKGFREVERPAGGSGDDWRSMLSGGDEATLKELQQFTDPGHYIRSTKKRLADMQTELRNGKRVPVLTPETPEDDRKYFQTALGIPDSPDKYKIEAKAPEGYEPSEADQAILKSIVDGLHKSGGYGATPEVINLAHSIYYDAAHQAEAQRIVASEEVAKATERNLKTEWGQDYDVNMRMVSAAINDLAEQAGMRDADRETVKDLLNQELVNGGRLGDQEWFLRIMAAAGRMRAQDPYFNQIVAGSESPTKSLEEQLDDIMKLYRSGTPENLKKYYSPEAQKKQRELRQALDRAKGQPV